MPHCRKITVFYKNRGEGSGGGGLKVSFDNCSNQVKLAKAGASESLLLGSTARYMVVVAYLIIAWSRFCQGQGMGVYF